MSVQFVSIPGSTGQKHNRILIEVCIGSTDPVLYREYLTLDLIQCLKQANTNRNKRENDFEHVYDLLEALVPDSEEENNYEPINQNKKGGVSCQ